MIVLGVSYTGGHDRAAALMKDGLLIVAAEEERFTRQKHDEGVPYNTIEYCLSAARMEVLDGDVLALPDLPCRFARDSYVGEMEWRLVPKRYRYREFSGRHLIHRASATG